MPVPVPERPQAVSGPAEARQLAATAPRPQKAPAGPDPLVCGAAPSASGPVVQAKIKKSTVGRFAWSVIRGLVNAVFPVFGFKDYFTNLADIHKDRTGEGVLYGNGMGLAVLAGAKETAQIVATVATAVGVLFGIASIFMPPVAAMATTAGVVATAAHLITLVLRAISVGSLAQRLKQVRDDHGRRGKLKSQLYTEIGGIVGNMLGVLFGGLGGGFTPLAASNPLTDAASSVAANTGARTAAYLGFGQVGNSLADAAGAVGAARARGAEKRAERLQGTAEDPEAVEMDELAAVRGHALAQPEPEPDEEVDDERVDLALDVLSQLRGLSQRDVNESVSLQTELAQQATLLQEGQVEVGRVVQQIEPLGAVQSGLQAVELNPPADLRAEQVEQVEASLGQMHQAMPEVVEDEGGEKDAVQDDAIQEDTADEEDLDSGPSADSSGYEADDEREDTQLKARAPRPDPTRERPVVQAEGGKASAKPKGFIGRSVDKAKDFGRRLLVRAKGLGRRMAAGAAKAKARLVGALLRLLGLQQPAAEAHMQVAEQAQKQPEALLAQQGLQAASDDTAAKAAEAESQIKKAKESAGLP